MGEPPVTGKIQRLQAERGECGEPAADPHHHEGPRIGRQREATLAGGQCAEEPDDEGTDDVDQDGAPGKGGAGDPPDRQRQPGARHAAKRAADGNRKIENHGLGP
jgi:hypothetical protein